MEIPKAFAIGCLVPLHLGPSEGHTVAHRNSKLAGRRGRSLKSLPKSGRSATKPTKRFLYNSNLCHTEKPHWTGQPGDLQHPDGSIGEGNIAWRPCCGRNDAHLSRSIYHITTCWWFQPIRKILVKFDHFPRYSRGENKKCLKPPPRLTLSFLVRPIIINPIVEVGDSPQSRHPVHIHSTTCASSFRSSWLFACAEKVARKKKKPDQNLVQSTIDFRCGWTHPPPLKDMLDQWLSLG